MRFTGNVWTLEHKNTNLSVLELSYLYITIVWHFKKDGNVLGFYSLYLFWVHTLTLCKLLHHHQPPSVWVREHILSLAELFSPHQKHHFFSLDPFRPWTHSFQNGYGCYLSWRFLFRVPLLWILPQRKRKKARKKHTTMTFLVLRRASATGDCADRAAARQASNWAAGREERMRKRTVMGGGAEGVEGVAGTVESDDSCSFFLSSLVATPAERNAAARIRSPSRTLLDHLPTEIRFRLLEAEQSAKEKRSFCCVNSRKHEKAAHTASSSWEKDNHKERGGGNTSRNGIRWGNG